MSKQDRSYNIRPLAYKTKAISQYFLMDQFSASNDAIPLQENWAERWCTLGKGHAEIMEDVLNFDIRPDDVFVNSFMKCGTTWMQETAWLLLNNLDFVRAKRTNVIVRCPNLDGSGAVKQKPSTLERCRMLYSPRLMKSHLPPNLLPRQVWQKRAKIIFVARNLKDCVVSGYHFTRNLGSQTFNMDDFIDDFLNNGIVYTPYLEVVVDYWKMRHEPNICFVTYEEMKRNLGAVLQRLCKFLGRPELTAQQLKKTVHHLSFDNMKLNGNAHLHDYCLGIESVNPNKDFKFMRRGIIGSYKDDLSPENIKKLQDWSNSIFDKHNIKEEDIFGKY